MNKTELVKNGQVLDILISNSQLKIILGKIEKQKIEKNTIITDLTTLTLSKN